MTDSNPRKKPLRVRRGSKKEFSRVASLLDGRIEANEKKIAALEERLAKIENRKPRRKRSTKNKSEESQEAPDEN